MSGEPQTGGLWAQVKHAFAIPSQCRLTEPQRRWMERLADRIVRRGLATPATFLLQGARPLNFVASELTAFLKPIAASVLRPEQCDEMIHVLGQRGAAQELLQMIEERERAGRREPDET